MALAKVTTLLVVFVAVAAAKSVWIVLDNTTLDDDSYEEFRSNRRVKRVIGGRDAFKGEFPWLVSLHHEGSYLNVGFLVTPKIMLTVAHALIHNGVTQNPKDYKGYVGTINRDGPGQEITFTKIIVHPEFSSAPGSFGYDIAIMKLAKPIKKSHYVHPICLPTKDSLYESTTGTVTGWGSGYKVLQKLPAKVPSFSTCKSFYEVLYIPTTEKIYICVDGEQNKGTCTGDSGGPLVVMNENKPVAVGIASFVFKCATEGQPSMFTAISAYTDWIINNIGGDAKDLCFVDKVKKFVMHTRPRGR